MTVHYIIGGKGDMSAAAEDWAGAYDPALTDWNAAQGVDGTYLDLTAVGVISDNGSGKVRVAAANAFTNSVEGVYANLITGPAPGRYRIDLVNDDYIDLDLTYSSSATDVSCIVGGAVADDADDDNWTTIELATDIAVAGDTVKVRSIMTLTGVGDIVINGNDGTSIAHIVVEAVDIDGDRDLSTKVVVTMTSGFSLPVITLSNNVKYWEFHGFDFNGNSNSTFVLESTGAETYNSFYSCIFRDARATADIVRFAGDYLYMYDCEATGATGGVDYHGINNKSQYAVYDSCYIHDNTGGGIVASVSGSGFHRIFNCRIIANNIGINTDGSATNLIIINCTIADNVSDGINISGSLADWTVTHCNITGNGGYGIHTNGNGPQTTVFQYNNAGTGASVNSSGAMDVGTWAIAGDGDNVTLDPQYDANFFTRNINLIQGGKDKRPIGPIHRIWKPPLSRGAA